MPGLSGAHVITEIRKLSPKAHVIVVTSYDADEDVYRAMQAGARCYLLKDTFTEGMLDAIRMVHAGRRLIDPALAARLVDKVNDQALTTREVAVLGLVARGKTNRQIAEDAVDGGRDGQGPAEADLRQAGSERPDRGRAGRRPARPDQAVMPAIGLVSTKAPEPKLVTATPMAWAMEISTLVGLVLGSART